MTPDALMQTMRAQRTTWVDLPEGRRVQILRPTEAEILEHFLKPSARKGGGVTLTADLPQVKLFVVGWDGFTEVTFVGPAGASDLVPFDAALWAAYIDDHVEDSRQIAQRLIDEIAKHHKLKADAEKNS